MPSDLEPLDGGDRKPPRRNWLLLPYALVVLLLVGWSVGWFLVKGELERRLDREADALRGSGWTVATEARRVDGFPFRLRLTYERAELRAPSGWQVSIPGLEAQAYLHAPDHWVLLAPRGLTFVRPKGGAVEVTGQSLRASLAGLRRPIWRVVLEGRKLKFAPGPGARPFSLASAELLDFYFQPTPLTGQARWLFRVQAGRAAPYAILGLLAQDQPVESRSEGRLTRLDAWRSSPSGGPARSWAAAGGALQLDQAELRAGRVESRLANPASLNFGPDGRLRGLLALDVRPAVAALAALGGLQAAPEIAERAAAVFGGPARDGPDRLMLGFQAGAATLGPVRVGPSPKLF